LTNVQKATMRGWQLLTDI